MKHRHKLIDTVLPDVLAVRGHSVYHGGIVNGRRNTG